MVQSAAYKEMLNINNYIREVNLKTTKRYQLTLIKMAIVWEKKKSRKQQVLVRMWRTRSRIAASWSNSMFNFEQYEMPYCFPQ